MQRKLTLMIMAASTVALLLVSAGLVVSERATLRLIFVLILACSLATFLIALFLQRITSKPMSDLAAVAKTIEGQKNDEMPATKGAEGEMGQLTSGFNEKLSQIQQRDAALQQVNDNLEKRVYERTKDLQSEIIERKRAEEALQEQLTRIRLLNQITRIISDRQDLSSILHVVLRQLADRLRIHLGLFCLYDAPAQSFRITALHATEAALAGGILLHQGAVLALAETGLQPCLEGELVHLDGAKTDLPLPKQLAQSGLQSTLAVPLRVENELFGVLLLGRSSGELFTAGECEFLRALSEQVGLAAHQAELHHQLEQAYNELRQTQQAVMQQERLRALGQMASGIAHDINNALSPVVGFADLLARSETSLSDNGKKYLHYIKTAGEDIAQIVARLREFYRRRNQREALTAFSLNDAAQQVIDMTRPRWRDIPQGQGLMIEVESELEQVLAPLVGNESEVREALTNLILNAVDALPKGGKITVRTRSSQQLSPRADGRLGAHVLVEVRDNGIGMNETTRKHCFEPFFSTKGKRGTGLGLAMVYGVMERHEGTIEVQSELGQGTSVMLIFPVRKAETAESSRTAETGPVTPLQVLCIDDEPLLRELLRNLLETEGHRVEVSDGGKAGLEAFRAAQQRGNPFDVVITDLGMPYLDGRQVAKALKRESPKTPVILLTGWGAFMKEDGQFPEQIDSVLSKPPRSRELRETLQRLTSPPSLASSGAASPP